MELPDLECPPPSPGSSTGSLNAWFAITREDLPRAAAVDVDSESDTDGDFVLVLTETDIDRNLVLVGGEGNIEPEVPYFLPPRADTHSLVHKETPPPSRPATPGSDRPIPTASPPTVILLNARKVTAPGFNTEAALTFDDRWIGREARVTRSTKQWWSCGCCRRQPLGQHEMYPLADVVFVKRLRDTTVIPTELRHTPDPARPFMDVRVVDAAEELAYRLAREAVRGPPGRRERRSAWA